MTKDEVITELNSLEFGDNEAAHCFADDYLIKFLTNNGLVDVAEAWTDASERCEFWYA